MLLLDLPKGMQSQETDHGTLHICRMGNDLYLNCYLKDKFSSTCIHLTYMLFLSSVLDRAPRSPGCPWTPYEAQGDVECLLFLPLPLSAGVTGVCHYFQTVWCWGWTRVGLQACWASTINWATIPPANGSLTLKSKFGSTLYRLDEVVYACSPTVQEAEAEGLRFDIRLDCTVSSR